MTHHQSHNATTGQQHQAEGKWKQFMGNARAKWGDLTDQEMEQFKGNMQAAGGYIQEKYGVAKEEVAELFSDDKVAV